MMKNPSKHSVTQTESSDYFFSYAEKHTDEDQICHKLLGRGPNYFTSERVISSNHSPDYRLASIQKICVISYENHVS